MRSDTIKKGTERAPHRSLLKATGVTDADLDKPFIAVANSFCEIIPGHAHLDVVGRDRQARPSAPPAACPSSSTPSASTTASPWATAA